MILKRNTPLQELVYFSLFGLITACAILLLVAVIGLLLSSGYAVLSWQFLTESWQHREITKGGVFPAIFGSFMIGIGVSVVSFPLGIATALFLTEYSKNQVLKRIIQLSIRNLAGVPSVVYGLFGLGIFVHMLSLGMSLLSAILTLSLMTLPWVIVSSAESLLSVPQKFRDSSLALGATPFQTTCRITLPCALPGCITGSIIGVARAMGETAPIILVGATFYMSRLPQSILDPFMALPYHAFILATQHSSPHAFAYAAGTSVVLMVMTFVLSLGAILLRTYLRRRKNW
ncbi:MAG: phosphate ABC transporter permease PstA [Candidatus Peribacteraceae bacterium]|nr:phosphate ABC transporter permease PstA [Candidatus Peribacteraceae bacterium]